MAGIEIRAAEHGMLQDEAGVAPLTAAASVPLVVDLDGTLLRSDLLLETWLLLLRKRPWRSLLAVVWLLGGKAQLKARLAAETRLDVSSLPYDDRVLRHLRSERAGGRRVVLATASNRVLADQIAAHLGVFDEVIASDDRQNVSRTIKRDRLVSRFGEQGFDYIANAHDDLPVWRAARRAVVANPHPGVERCARAQGNVEAVWPSLRPASWRVWIKALRAHQWAKNLLVFVPAVAAHHLAEPQVLGATMLAFLLFGLCASGGYLLNDLLDLPDDRQHTRKRFRPIACGDLPIGTAVAAGLALGLTAFLLSATFLPPAFTWVLATYFTLSLGYSLFLKRFMAIDILTLAMLYTLRIVAGGTAGELELSFWILGFSVFIFLSLALVKRYAELRATRDRGAETLLRGRGYHTDDLPMISSLGAAAGYMSALVLALYINDLNASALYSHAELIWFACPLLLLWITRVWLLTHRGQMHDDPVVFALKDRASLVIGLLMALVFWAAA